MHTRRDFLKRTALLSSAAAFSGAFPETIQRAFAIDPAPGSSYLDAEHVVILMQENRSFDHALGALRGVRGFNDPRALRLANGNPVWLQSNAKGETYVPFRFDIKDTRVTWMSYLPHNRQSQVDAWNHGLYDQWLPAKRSGKKEYADMPLVLGHYTREDIPFYYALADAFTICDQNFSGVMSSTTPNRSVFWTHTIRALQNARSKANIRNDDYFGDPVQWPTFPEQLQKNGISWKLYQNDLWRDYGMSKEEVAWLSNFGTNLLELFAQYNVNRFERYQQGLPQAIAEIEKEIVEMTSAAVAPDAPSTALTDLNNKKRDLARCKKDMQLGPGAFTKLTSAEQELHLRAFTTNEGDPNFHTMERLKYADGSTQREMSVPKGDPLHQFREDVRNGKLPTISWLCSPERFSDHPQSPWYGAWYVSEVMDILTKNPEVWRKTIFILTYDENDGYFDHVPPYIAPDPKDASTGRVSPGLESEAEYIYKEDEVRQGVTAKTARTGPVGLGYRVPMIVASPWSRGGWVNSQLFEHTSVNKFLEKFLSARYGKKSGNKVEIENISPWRNAIAGDLTSIFHRFDGNKPAPLPFLKRDPFVEGIHKAQFQPPPSDYRKLSDQEIASIAQDPLGSALMPHQEKGTRPACAIPYELYVEARLSGGGSKVEMNFRAGNKVFGKQAVGAPFNVYTRRAGKLRSATYTVAAGASLQESWPLDDSYHFEVHGPNGFFGEFAGDKSDPALGVVCEYEADAINAERLTGHIALHFSNAQSKPYLVEIVDRAYGARPIKKMVGTKDAVVLDLEKSFGWYDFSVKVSGFANFERRYAGHVETGRPSTSDPLMGGMLKA